MSSKVRWIDSLWTHTAKVYSLSGQNGPIRVRLERAMARPMILFERICRTHRTGQSPDWYVQPLDRSPIFIAFVDKPYPFADSLHRTFYCDFGTPLNGLVYRIMGGYISERR